MPCRVLVSAWALALDSLPTASLPQTALPIAAVVAPWIFRPRSSGEWSSDRWRPLRKQDFLHGKRRTDSCPTDSTREAIGSHSICLPFKLEPTCQLGFSFWKRVFCWWIPFFGVWQPRFKNPFRYRSWDFYLWNIPSMVWKWKIRKIHLAMGTFVNTFYSLIFFWVFIRRFCLNPLKRSWSRQRNFSPCAAWIPTEFARY